MSVQKFPAFLTGKNMPNINNEDISNLSKDRTVSQFNVKRHKNFAVLRRTTYIFNSSFFTDNRKSVNFLEGTICLKGLLSVVDV